MRDEMDIGAAPSFEDCVQVGTDDYMERSRAESLRYIEAIKKKLGEPPPGARLKLKYNPHDFGTYISVVCSYDDGNPEGIAYAMLCESDGPKDWNDVVPLPRCVFEVEVECHATLTLTVEARTKSEAEVLAKAEARYLREGDITQFVSKLAFKPDGDAFARTPALKKEQPA